MSDELISISDFLDWAKDRACVYGCRLHTLMGRGWQAGYKSVVDLCNEAIACSYIRDQYLCVADMALALQRFNEELIQRSTLLNMLRQSSDVCDDELTTSLTRALEHAHQGRTVDVVAESQNAIRHKYGMVEYRRMYHHVRAMPTVDMKG